MAVVSICHHLHKDRTLARAAHLGRVLHRRANRDHVLAVAAHARHVVAARVVLGRARGARGRGAHAVEVVLYDEDERQAPERSHVGRLVDLALVGRAVAEQRGADLGRVFVLAGERDAAAHGDLGSD